MKYIALIFMVLVLVGCENDNKSHQKVIGQQAENQTDPQKQLEEEFGEYNEEVTSEDLEYYKAYNTTLKLWKTPFHELNVKTSFGKAHIIVSGPKNGEPLVLLHGLNASSTMWYPNITALSQNHRVYAIDNLLEPGKSRIEGEVKDMMEMVSWYNEIFDQLKLEKFTLIGASKGGWLAIYIALQQKARIKNIVLLSPAQTFMWINPGSEMLANLTYTLAPKRKRLHGVMETMSVDVDKIEKSYIEQYFIATQKATFSKFILQMTPYSDNELKSLTMPVLLLIGDNDIINNEKSIEKAKELLPHSETGMIKNAGHFLSIDQSEVVNKRILQFLSLNQESSRH
ncbi:MAG: alpha/beta hydrolase [Bacteroidetes bacterium HGW-Bacteroidetes-16]|jgi:pimeloyl-ACP methyl ester carboxylesterase|nr:MAG: alpha/beta hydrolase [Bacteroidetes bacterium HGW-Bacteroidetes-16]